METDITYLMEIIADYCDQRTPKLREAAAIELFSALQKDFLEVVAIPDGELRVAVIELFTARLARTWQLVST